MSMDMSMPGCSLVTAPGSFLPDTNTTVTVHVPATGGAVDGSNHEVLNLFGFACAGGSIGLSTDHDAGSMMPTCTGTNAVGWTFLRSLPIHDPASPDPPNNNPVITDVKFGPADALMSLDDAAPPTIPVCADQDQHQGCTQFQFEVFFADGSRESYHSTDPNDGGVTVRAEYLTTGYAITGGTLDGAFRTDSSADPMSNMENGFYAPAQPGQLHLVSRRFHEHRSASSRAVSGSTPSVAERSRCGGRTVYLAWRSRFPDPRARYFGWQSHVRFGNHLHCVAVSLATDTAHSSFHQLPCTRGPVIRHTGARVRLHGA
jgi:hypothetical protein